MTRKSMTTARKTLAIILALLAWRAIDRNNASAQEVSQTYRPWYEYFPKADLRNQNDEKVKFPDELKDKIVVINFMYTRCDGEICADGTRNLVKLQNLLGDRFGREVFLYSITLEPLYDTPIVLKEYATRYDARWSFLTGKPQDITKLRRKLGLSNPDPKADADPKTHNRLIVIGNPNLEKWEKKDIFSSPYDILEMIERVKPPQSEKQ